MSERRNESGGDYQRSAESNAIPKTPLSWFKLIAWSFAGTIVYQLFGHAAVWPTTALPSWLPRAITEIFDTIMTFAALVAFVGAFFFVPFAIVAGVYSVAVRREGLDGLLRWYQFAKPFIAIPLTVYFNYWAQLEIREEAYGRAVERAEPLVAAIDSYTEDQGELPDALSYLLPEYLDAIPTTNLAGFPRYRYWVFAESADDTSHAKLWISAQWRLGLNGELTRFIGLDSEIDDFLDPSDFEAYPGWYYID